MYGFDYLPGVPDLEDVVFEIAVYPYWNLCLVIASLWLGLGVLVFGIDRWRRYRAYRSANDTSATNPALIGPQKNNAVSSPVKLQRGVVEETAEPSGGASRLREVVTQSVVKVKDVIRQKIW